MNLSIIDYGAGNLLSVKHKLKKNGIDAQITSSLDDVEKSDYIIICGVGHFANAMSNLRKNNLVEVLNEKIINQKTPILGICLGMQLFSNSSEEGSASGFGWIDAEVNLLKFPSTKHKVPHIGWKKIYQIKESSLLNNLNKDLRYYFIHSYHVVCNDKNDILSTSHYGGIDLVSSIQKNNILGTQFHPEKSHLSGMKLIEKFFEHY